MYRLRLSIAFAVLVALVCVQAGFVYWGAHRVYGYAQHSRLASDILSELLEISANKQRLRVWASQQLMSSGSSIEVRDRLLARMKSSAATLKDLAARDLDVWNELASRDDVQIPPEVQQLIAVAALLEDNIAAVQARLAKLTPLEHGSEFSSVWQELNEVFDMAGGRDLRELVNGAIERQRQVVPVARAATEAGLDSLRSRAIVMALVTLVLAIALSLRLGRLVQRPLDRLLAGIKALQSGALDHRVAVGSGDEFDRVAEHFNKMAAELQQHRGDSDAARRRLEEAVEARTSELRSAHETLQRLDGRRRQLFADLSHELRTPTTVIRGEAEIALRGADKGIDDYKQALSRIVGGVQQLVGVTDDLLMVAKSEADQLALRFDAVELQGLVHDAADQARALGALHEVEIVVEDPRGADDRPVFVQADIDRLRQAVMITLDNAVRYSIRGGTVRLSWRADPHADPQAKVGQAVVEVVDQGIGIDAEELPTLFQRFVRGRRAREHRADGSGIGLSIAKAIVQAHRGEISVESAPHAGTTVRIALPCSVGEATVASSL